MKVILAYSILVVFYIMMVWVIPLLFHPHAWTFIIGIHSAILLSLVCTWAIVTIVKSNL